MLRPLAEAITGKRLRARTKASGGTDAADLGDRLWTLAQRTTRALAGWRGHHEQETQLMEATAALQDLALRSAPPGERDRRLEMLRELLSDRAQEIRCAHNGPYLVTNAGRLRDWLGQEIEIGPQVALCRCGASGINPVCDGACASSRFTDRRDPKRVPDKRDSYAGVQLTVYDNRGICQHSGFCTDRLNTVFHTDGPFVTPSGGRMDEIIRAVRDCPSGALSYAIDGIEAREQVDWGGGREPAIEVSKDGPYRIAGGIPLSDVASRSSAPRAPRLSTTRYAAAGTRRTSRSAAACTGTSSSRTRSPTLTPPRRCSNGAVGSRRSPG